MKQLGNREKEQPEPDHRGEDAQDEHGSTALIQMWTRGCPWIEIGVGNSAKSHPGAKGCHE
jgi:hypothetical protein